MKQYNLLQAIYMSFYSKKLYRDVAMNWGGHAFLYLLLLIALSWVPSNFKFQHSFDAGFNDFRQDTIPQIPVLIVKDGKISTPQDHPYYIIDVKTHENIAVIDTSGKYKSLNDVNAILLVTKDKIYSKAKSDETRIDELPATLNMTLNPISAAEQFSHFSGYLWLPFFLIVVLMSYAYRLVQALIYSLLGVIYCSITNTKCLFGQVMHIAMVSITPVIVLTVILDFLSISFPYQSLLYFGLAMAYLIFGLKANNTEN